MATQTVTFGYTSGETLTLKLGALATDTIVGTASATERSNQTGIYAAAFTDVAAGVYRAIAYSGSTPVFEGFVELTATTAVFNVEADNPTDRTTILNRIGAFTGTGVNTILGFFKAIMFSDASIPPDAGDTFEASLEDVKSVTVLPYSATSPTRQDGTTIFLFVAETHAQQITIYDADENERDLSGMTLSLLIKLNGDVIQTATPTVSGANNSIMNFTPDSDVTAQEQTLDWSLRDTSNSNEVIAQGKVIVSYAA